MPVLQALEPTTTTTTLDLVAVAGIVGTLLAGVIGAALGAWATLRVQRDQREHHDRTRFHEHRVEVYSHFLDACDQLVAAWRVGNNPGEHMRRCNETLETIRLIGTRAVSEAAFAVQAKAYACVDAQPAQREAAWQAFNATMALAAVAMRTEIGTDA
jgi:hypothetical protein